MSMRRGTLVLVLPFALAAACAGPDRAVAPAGEVAARMGGPTMGGPGGGQTALAQVEIRFMQEMIDHHQMAVEMGRLCTGRGLHDEFLGLCETVVATQSAEVLQMQGWLQGWYGVAKTPALSAADQASLARLAARTGTDFEIAWMEEMIPHHHMAIMRARQLRMQGPRHPELAQLANTIVATQTAEIHQMQGWLAAWYGRPGGMMGGGRPMGGGGPMSGPMGGRR